MNLAETQPVPSDDQTTATSPTTSDETSWGEIAATFSDLSRFAVTVDEGRGADFTGEVKDAQKMLDALKVGRAGLEYLVEAFNEEIENSLAWHRSIIEGLTPLKIETAQPVG